MSDAQPVLEAAPALATGYGAEATGRRRCTARSRRAAPSSGGRAARRADRRWRPARRDPAGQHLRRPGSRPTIRSRRTSRNTLRPPSWAHPFGTDNFGRDVFSRVLHAAKLDLMIGFLCVLFPWIAGHRARRHRRLCRRHRRHGRHAHGRHLHALSRSWSWRSASSPSSGPGLTSHVHRADPRGWSIYARIVRAEVLVARKGEYVLAARALGYTHARILSAPHPAQRHHADRSSSP